MAEEMDGTKFLSGILKGAQQVIHHHEELNAINVFPVSDGDTGSNLASLMNSLLQVKVTEMKLSCIVDEISDAALVGARGNSGLIFAQFLLGMMQGIKKQKVFISDFVFGLEKAVQEAYNAVLYPQEGTILTVLRKWVETVTNEYHQSQNFEKALAKGKDQTAIAVEQTTQQLLVLKKNQVVDAGAKGFYEFIEGFTTGYLTPQKITIQEKVTEKTLTSHEHVLNEAPVDRYCTEILLSNVTQSKDDVKERLTSLGTSLIVIGNHNALRVHIHTNHPEKIVETLAFLGDLVEQKVEDMRLQYQVSVAQKHSYAIVTDSVADLPDEFLLNEQIHILPMTIQNGPQQYLDKRTITTKNLDKFKKHDTVMTTAQPSIKTVDNLFTYLYGKYEKVLFITVSSQLSGTYQLIQQRVHKSLYNQEDIIVFDSKLNSAAQGILVYEASKALQHTSFEDVRDYLENLVKRIRIFVSVGDLQPMIDSGRIPKKLGQWAKKIHLYPLVTLNKNGKGKLLGFSFTPKNSQKKLFKKIRQLQKKQRLDYCSVVYTDETRPFIPNDFPIAYTMESSVAIAISAGKKSIGIATLEKE